MKKQKIRKRKVQGSEKGKEKEGKREMYSVREKSVG